MRFHQMIIQSLLLIMPVVIAGILHMVAVKRNILPRTKVPISPSLLGNNKTYRGVILMPVFTVMGTLLLYLVNMLLPLHIQLPLGLWQSIQLGVLLGMAYILFELPNSFIKRRLGIPPGKSPDKFKLLFRLLDRLDSTLGCLVVFYFFLKVEAATLSILLIMGIIVHGITTNILYLLQIRQERW